MPNEQKMSINQRNLHCRGTKCSIKNLYWIDKRGMKATTKKYSFNQIKHSKVIVLVYNKVSSGISKPHEEIFKTF